MSQFSKKKKNASALIIRADGGMRGGGRGRAHPVGGKAVPHLFCPRSLSVCVRLPLSPSAPARLARSGSVRLGWHILRGEMVSPAGCARWRVPQRAGPLPKSAASLAI